MKVHGKHDCIRHLNVSLVFTNGDRISFTPLEFKRSLFMNHNYILSIIRLPFALSFSISCFERSKLYMWYVVLDLKITLLCKAFHFDAPVSGFENEK